MAMAEDKVHVAMFAVPVMGHLIPFSELAKRLSADFKCKVTFILVHPNFFSEHASFYVESLRCSCYDINILTLPDILSPQHGSNHYSAIDILTRESLQPVKQALLSFKSTESPVSAFITSIFCTSYIKEIAESGIPTYILNTNCAAFLTLMYSLPTLLSQISVSLSEVEFGIQIPGLPAIPARDLPAPLLDRSSRVFQMFSGCALEIRGAAGILVNSFDGLEASAKEAAQGMKLAPVYNIGPLLPSQPQQGEENGDGKNCLKWLDLKPPNSVVFISFGTVATVSGAQISEIAAALEKSSYNFLWVARKEDSSSSDGPQNWVPREFLQRTSGRGLVQDWVPQIEVLRHPAIAGFVSHCGWNSTLESVCCGVPIVPWPIQGEQRMNAVMLLKEYGVGVELQRENDGFVTGEQLQKSLKELMEGKEGQRARNRAQELKQQAKDAIAYAGSSWKSVADVVSKWKNL